MDEASKRGPWIAALVITAVVAAGATWFVVGRDGSEPLGEPTAASTVESAESDDEPSWLFSQTAGAGTFSTDADGVSTLTLVDVDPGVIGFTDRPNRDTAVIEVASFVEAWPSMFAESAPNAVLVEHQPDGEADSFVVELSNPRLDGTTLSFTAEVLDGEDHADIAGVTATPHTDPPATFEVVSLFIDSVSPGFVYICVKNDTLLDPPEPVESLGMYGPPVYPLEFEPFEQQCFERGGEVHNGLYTPSY